MTYFKCWKFAYIKSNVAHHGDTAEADGCDILSDLSNVISRQLFSTCDSYENERNKWIGVKNSATIWILENLCEIISLVCVWVLHDFFNECHPKHNYSKTHSQSSYDSFFYV